MERILGFLPYKAPPFDLTLILQGRATEMRGVTVLASARNEHHPASLALTLPPLGHMRSEPYLSGRLD